MKGWIKVLSCEQDHTCTDGRTVKSVEVALRLKAFIIIIYEPCLSCILLTCSFYIYITYLYITCLGSKKGGMVILISKENLKNIYVYMLYMI